MARQRKNLNVKRLKKTTSGTYYDPQSRQEFSKTKKGYNMVIGKYEKSQHQQNVKRLRNLNKKYGGAFNYELNEEQRRWNEYKESIKQFNKGEISRPSTVKRRFQDWNKASIEQSVTYSKGSKKIATIVEDKKKVEIMRKTGKHGIYNGKAYDDYIKTVADKLDLSFEETEELIFPYRDEVGELDSDQIKRYMNQTKTKTIDDVISEKRERKDISEAEEIELQNLVMLGE